MAYPKDKMSSKPSSVDSKHPAYYKVDKVMQFGNMADAGKLKGASIGVTKRSPADGGNSQPVKIADNYAKHIRSEWQKSKGYVK